MNDFHLFIRRISLGWLTVYLLVLLVALSRPLTFFTISAFDFAPTYYWELVSTLRTAAFWLIPTGFLAVAFVLSHPNRKWLR
jgi:hypothetical protein